MARKGKATREKKPPTERQLRIAEIRAVAKDARPTEMKEELVRLVGEERRDNFLRLLPRRAAKVKKAVEGIINLSNAATYSYTEDEAAQIVTAFSNFAAEVKRSFTGTPKEKGMWDL